MSDKFKPSWLIRAVVLAFAALAVGAANASSLTLNFDTSFGDPLDLDTAPPDGPAPWLTAFFDDGGTPGSVTLTLTVAGTVGIAEITQVYLNVDPAIGPLTITPSGGTGPTPNEILSGTDAYKAGDDGLFDILIDMPPPGEDRFDAGETLVFDITASGLLASSFNFLSTPDLSDPGGSGPFLGAAKAASTGSSTVQCNSINGPIGQCSDWIAAVPVPAAVWLFGSALGLLGWARRKSA